MTVARRWFSGFGAIALCAVLVTACGGGGSTTSGNGGHGSHHSTSTGSAKQQIKKNWQSFFRHDNPTKDSIHVLQKGPQFKDTILQHKKSVLAQHASTKVTKVKLVNPKKAKVTYTVSTSGTPVLRNQHGEALKINGTWKISAASFCSLLHLQGQHPKACPSSSGGGS